MLLMTLKVSDDKALQALGDFIKGYQNSSEEAGLSRFSLLAADGDTEALKKIGMNGAPWKWWDNADPKLVEARRSASIHTPFPSQTIPEELRKFMRRELNNLLYALAKEDKFGDYPPSLDGGNGVLLWAYSDHLKRHYIDPEFKSMDIKTDYHQVLIDIAKEATVISYEDMVAYSVDVNDLEQAFDDAKGLAAVACYLLEHCLDYFWALIALSKSQKLAWSYLSAMNQR
jgi:hypothetical protein